MPKHNITRNLLRATLLASLAMPAGALLPAASPLPFAATKAYAGMLAEHRTVLEQYGRFQPHGKYGEVWIPTATPQGWHPYPPCYWVYTKHGWHFDDKTPWGQIVHHYGRWTHDGGSWIWVPGEEYSPGWVVWKANQEWVGWAPTPPEEDMKTLDVQAFNSDKMWIFMDTRKFGKNCDGGIAPSTQVPMLLTRTQYIRDVAVVDGIVVFVFPSWLIGPIVDIDIFNINVWSPVFIVNVINIWNIVWNVNIVVNIACNNTLPAMAPLPPPSNPPPPPGRRTELPPSTPPSGNTPPRQPPGTSTPPWNPPGGYTPPRQPPTTWTPPSFPPGGNYPPRPPGTGSTNPTGPKVVIDTFPPRPPGTGSSNPTGPKVVIDTFPPRPPRTPGSGITPGGNNIPGAGNGNGSGRPTGPTGNGKMPGGTSGLNPIKPIDPGYGRGRLNGNGQVGLSSSVGSRLGSQTGLTTGGGRGNLTQLSGNSAAGGKYRLR
jgi:Family of unknown function (DUF6600)